MIWLGIVIIVASFIVFVTAVEKVKYGEFNELSWWLASLGIYVWGQGVVLSFFWILFGLACLFWWNASQAMYVYILFHVARALIELFMLNQEEYRGLSPVFSLHKTTPMQQKQLYQLSQGLIMVIGMIIIAFLSIK